MIRAVIDTGDDFVVDCVVNSRSILVTSNTKDFRVAAQKLGFLMVTPLEFVPLLTQKEQS